MPDSKKLIVYFLGLFIFYLIANTGLEYLINKQTSPYFTQKKIATLIIKAIIFASLLTFYMKYKMRKK